MESLTIAQLKQREIRVSRHRYTCTRVPFRELLEKIEPVELRDAYLRFYDGHPFFKVVCAGTKHHHWWEGGLEVHCKEMIGIGLDLLEMYPGDLNKITPTDVVIIVFLHDFAKIMTYSKITDEDRKRSKEKYWEKQQFKFANNGAFDLFDHETWTLLRLGTWGITPTKEQWSAVVFAEGGYADANFGFAGRTNAGEKAMGSNPLIPFVHILDLYSSQLLGKSLIVERQIKEIKDAQEDRSTESSEKGPEPQGTGGGETEPGSGGEVLSGAAG